MVRKEDGPLRPVLASGFTGGVPNGVPKSNLLLRYEAEYSSCYELRRRIAKPPFRMDLGALPIVLLNRAYLAPEQPEGASDHQNIQD